MENLITVARLLGEDNKKRLKDTITDMIIRRVEEDLDNYDGWIVDFEYLHDEIDRAVQNNVKNKMINRYTEEIERKLNVLFDWIGDKYEENY